MMLFKTFSILIIFIFSCSSLQENNKAEAYNLETPTEIFVLERELNEISSLAYNSKGNNILTNEDESGIVFMLNKENCEIVKKENFAKEGDYESIEMVDDDIIICKNSGTLFFYNSITKKTKKIKTPLSKENNVEGLCYLKTKNALLLACKGQPLDQKKGKKNKKCVYAYDLSKNVLNPDPFLKITDDELEDFLKNDFNGLTKSQFKKFKNKLEDFAPSGIAVHPITGSYFIISARGSTLIIIGTNKKIKKIHFLDDQIIVQPEGITFDDNNNLFIATEGSGYNGKIFKFAVEK